MKKKDVIVYSCSGCSSAAQMANAVAVGLDRSGIAEMSCIAGVGGGVPSLVRKARAAEIIVGIDGCPLACVQACLKQQGLSATYHYELTCRGVKKRFREDFEPAEAKKITNEIYRDLRGKLAVLCDEKDQTEEQAA